MTKPAKKATPRKAPAKPRKRAATAAEVVATTSTDLVLPNAPGDLTPSAAAIWDELCIDLAQSNNLRGNLEGVRMMAVAAARGRAATADIDRLGMLVIGANDAPILNPLLKIERESTATFLRLAAEYGLTPAAQLRLGLAHLRGQALMADIEGAATQRDEVAAMNADLELDDLDISTDLEL